MIINGKEMLSKKPHVVILGAGASRASFPEGDENGKKLPLMDDFVESVGLKNILKNTSFKNKGNFEDVYNQLANTDKSLAAKINKKIIDYFSSLEIVIYKPSIYDYLLLSLRSKDIIASFNWDPLLLQTYRQYRTLEKDLPELVFLHGNVSIRVCEKCKSIFYRDPHDKRLCLKCEGELHDPKIFYPTKDKDYRSDPVISYYWDTITQKLEEANCLTVFGYGSIDSDKEAATLMLNACNKNDFFQHFAEVEIITGNLKDGEDWETKKTKLRKRWDKFIKKDHYAIHTDFKDSILYKYPRRTCEAMFSMHLMNIPWKENTFQECRMIDDIHKWIGPLLKEESDLSSDY